MDKKIEGKTKMGLGKSKFELFDQIFPPHSISQNIIPNFKVKDVIPNRVDENLKSFSSGIDKIFSAAKLFDRRFYTEFIQQFDVGVKSILDTIQNHKDLWIENYNKDYKWFIFHGVSIEQYQTIATGKLEGKLKSDRLNEAIDVRFLEIYAEDDFLLLKDSLNTLKTSEWGEDISHIIDFANEDIRKNYVTILPFLYMMVERKIRSYKKYKFNMHSLAETIEKIEDDITSSITLGLQEESSNIILESIKATKSDKFGGFKRHVKEESRAFNRNSVMHGSISPKYWDFMDFVKLVNATTFMLLWMPAYTGYDDLE